MKQLLELKRFCGVLGLYSILNNGIFLLTYKCIAAGSSRIAGTAISSNHWRMHLPEITCISRQYCFDQFNVKLPMGSNTSVHYTTIKTAVLKRLQHVYKGCCDSYLHSRSLYSPRLHPTFTVLCHYKALYNVLLLST